MFTHCIEMTHLAFTVAFFLVSPPFSLKKTNSGHYITGPNNAAKKVEIPQNCHKFACLIPKNPGNFVIPDKSNKLNRPRRLHFMSEAGPAMKIWSTLTHGEGPGHAH